jgi:DNA-binding transcriptional ArsR family regulator
MVKTLSHPLRLEALRILNDRVASPNEIAKELGESTSLISYHVKELVADGCVELVDEQPRRGAVEHYYRGRVSASGDDEAWSTLTKTARAEITAVALQGVIGEAVRALNEGTFDSRLDRHLSWLSMELDETGWGELVGKLGEWLSQLEQIKAGAAERLAGSGEPSRRFVTGLMGFEAPGRSGLGEPDS